MSKSNLGMCEKECMERESIVNSTLVVEMDCQGDFYFLCDLLSI